ncbi:uncharacterized protein [Antedon mediterranea]|uniref:uncharacterized protein n=1 Tax=Antedon mediterranea TaxID=105859 RepID=UPI003AF64BC8
MSEANLALQSCKIIVHRARNLIVKGRDNTNSSYALICSGKEKFQTAVVDKTLFPQWNEECILYIYKENSSVDIIIYNRGLVLDDLIGQVNIPLSSVKEDGRPVRSWYKLEGKSAKSKKERGDVEITIQVKSGLNPYAPMHSWNMAKMKQTQGEVKDDKKTVQSKITTADPKKEKQSSAENSSKPQLEMKQSEPVPKSIPKSDPKFVKKTLSVPSVNDLNKAQIRTPPTQRRRLAKYAPAHRRLSMPYANIDPNTTSPATKSSYHVDPNHSKKGHADSLKTETSELEVEDEDVGSIANRRRSSSESAYYRSYQTLPHRKLVSVDENTEKKHVQRDAKFRHSFHSSDQPSAQLSIPAKNKPEPVTVPSEKTPVKTPEVQSEMSSEKSFPDSPIRTPPVKPPRNSPTRALPIETTLVKQTQPNRSPVRSARYGSDTTDSDIAKGKMEEKRAASTSPTNTSVFEMSRTPSPNGAPKPEVPEMTSPAEPKPVIINIDGSINSGYSVKVPTRPYRKPKTVSSPMARFENMSKEDLATKVLDLEEQLHQQSKCLRETQDYLNTLLLRVIVQNPNLLNRDLDDDY